MYSYLLNFCYDGKNFCGYQVQPNGRTVGAEILRALTSLFGSVESLAGCSRTDAGVHALNYYASFKASKELDPDTVVRALNALLPEDIAVKNCRFAAEDFHARYSVVRKEYTYRILTSAVRSPFRAGYVWYRPQPLDIDLLNSAAKNFIGTHDFSAFMAAGSDIKQTVRTVYDAHFERDGNEVVFRICANGFLYNMIRIIVGTLMQVQQGKITPGDIPEIIGSLDRRNAGPTAPAQGLYLTEVYYDFNGE